MGLGVSAMMTYEVEVVELAPQPAAVVREHVEPAGLPAFLGGAFGEVMRVLSEQRLSPAGAPFGRYKPTGDGFDAVVGFPATGPVSPAGRVAPEMLPGGPTARALHRGAYGEVGAAYEAAAAWLRDHGYVQAGEPWECYLDGPEVPEPRTLVYVPCRRA